MRYEVIHDEDTCRTYYVFDRLRGVVVANGYLNTHTAKAEADRLQEIENGQLQYS